MTEHPNRKLWLEANIPDELRQHLWILWRWSGKRKVPVDGWGKRVRPLWFDDAWQRYLNGEADGIGVILTQGLGGVDLDACLSADGKLADWASEIIERFKDTYAEVSPSGNGIKIFALGAPDQLSPNKLAMGPKIAGQKQPAIEAFVVRRWFAVTGERWDTSPSVVASCPAAWAWLASRLGASTAPVKASTRPMFVIEPDQLHQMLERIDVDQYSDHDAWFRLMASCHQATNGLGDGEFIAWSTSDPAYSDHDEIIQKRWDSLTADKAGGIGWGPLVAALRKAGALDSGAGRGLAGDRRGAGRGGPAAVRGRCRWTMGRPSRNPQSPRLRPSRNL